LLCEDHIQSFRSRTTTTFEPYVVIFKTASQAEMVECTVSNHSLNYILHFQTFRDQESCIFIPFGGPYSTGTRRRSPFGSQTKNKLVLFQFIPSCETPSQQVRLSTIRTIMPNTFKFAELCDYAYCIEGSRGLLPGSDNVLKVNWKSVYQMVCWHGESHSVQYQCKVQQRKVVHSALFKYYNKSDTAHTNLLNLQQSRSV
jgi:hypothetical protein